MSKIIVIAPHADDETLGLGGTLIKYKNAGYDIYWLIVTSMKKEDGFSEEIINKRKKEIIKIKNFYKFKEIYNLNYSTSKLDTIPLNDIINSIGNIFKKVLPEVIFLPYYNDIHSDHRIIHQASVACTKWFRFPSIKKILAYETLSETDISLDVNGSFNPNYFINIEETIIDKIKALEIYESEIGKFPFPRSPEAIHSLAKIRGSSAGFQAAEAFTLLKEIID